MTVERTLTDGSLPTDEGLADLPDRAALATRVEAVEERLEAVESRVDELDAATQAVRGYVGGVRAVNRAVERRADAAIAAVDHLERKVGDAGAVDEEALSAAVGDGEVDEVLTERLGTNERVSFRTGTVVVVAVPPWGTGVGDVDGVMNESSAG